MMMNRGRGSGPRGGRGGRGRGGRQGGGRPVAREGGEPGFGTILPDYEKEKEFLKRFLREFEEDGELKYVPMMERIAARETTVFPMFMSDLEEFCRSNPEHAGVQVRFESNGLRYSTLLAEAVQECLPDNVVVEGELDVNDMIAQHRVKTQEELAAWEAVQREAELLHDRADAADGEGEKEGEKKDKTKKKKEVEAERSADIKLHPELARRFELHVYPRTDMDVVPLREIKAEHIGKLVNIKGIVTRVSDVRPLAKVITYLCDECQLEAFQTVRGKTFMPLDKCFSPKCRKSGKPGTLTMQARGSKFVKFQEVRIQEPMDQVPIGSIPRCVNVRLEGEMTHHCVPGDIVTICGVFLPSQRTGFNTRGNILVADTYIQGLSIMKQNNKYSAEDVDESFVELVNSLHGQDLYAKLAHSLAPEIYGMEDVKKALLLQMVSAPTRVLSDGMKIRGDINILLMGDPGVAKSQLLKHVSKTAPRSVYTSGKGSTGVGLMAAVVKDPTTNEFILEGGSLVLADMGICCIDEFDKMEDTDRTAIYEVMEQQTISIAKAGITTTLNARASILAAANPVSGRYITSRTPAENVGMPPALLSRFDLMFILLDTPDLLSDSAKAEYIIGVHIQSNKDEDEDDDVAMEEMQQRIAKERREMDNDPNAEYFSSDFIRSYITMARTFTPSVPPSVASHIVSAYVGMRREEKDHPNEMHTYTSARSLLAILRISMALARVRFSDTVSKGDIEEAIRLTIATKEAISSKPRKGQSTTTDLDSVIFNIIRDRIQRNGGKDVPYSEVLQQVLILGHSEDALRQTIAQYENLGIITLAADSSTLRFNDWS